MRVGFWRSVNYEEVCLRAYDSVGEARASIGLCLEFTTESTRTRASTCGCCIKPVSTICRSARQHDLRLRRWGVAPRTAPHHDNRQRPCLSRVKQYLDEAGHL